MNRLITYLLFLLTATLSAMSQVMDANDNELTEEQLKCIMESLSGHLMDPDFTKVNPYRHIITCTIKPDSADVFLHQKKHFWRATAETVGTNLGIWAFDRYVQKGQFAYISWNTIKENFKHGFDWDDDHLSTNMFAHPYNGSIFFNAGRSNGYNFWQSELFAIGGSAMWEMCMEREYPSTNDIIATPIGGAAIGEVLYRTSDLILDDRSTGGERFGRELAAFIVDPMKGITRLVSGASWKQRSTSGRRFGIPPISVELSLGARSISLYGNDHGSRVGAVAEINIEYGDRFAETTRQPYDYFSFLMELQAIKTQPLLSRAEIVGRLLSKEIIDNKNLTLNVGLYQHFDYFDSDTIHNRQNDIFFPCSVPYKLGVPASIGGGAMIRYTGLGYTWLDGYVHFNGVALGGILTDFYRDYHRNYNWGSGFSIKAGINWATRKDKWSIKIANQFYRLFTWVGYDEQYDWSLTPEGGPVDVQGDISKSSFNHFEISANYKLWKRWYITAGLDLYHRYTIYDRTIHGPNWTSYWQFMTSDQIGCHLMLTYKL